MLDQDCRDLLLLAVHALRRAAGSVDESDSRCGRVDAARHPWVSPSGTYDAVDEWTLALTATDMSTGRPPDRARVHVRDWRVRGWDLDQRLVRQRLRADHEAGFSGVGSCR